MSAAGFRCLHRYFLYFRRPKRLMLNCGGKSTLKCALVGRKMFRFRWNGGGIFSGRGFSQICVLYNSGFRTDFTRIVCTDFAGFSHRFYTDCLHRFYTDFAGFSHSFYTDCLHRFYTDFAGFSHRFYTDCLHRFYTDFLHRFYTDLWGICLG
jgi:hypothetical protein